jgi:hypothetical protein
MKPDSELHYPSARLTQSVPLLHNNHKSLPKTNTQQKLKPSLPKTLKQHIDDISRQQWISDAAYYKAEARGFMPGFELTDWLEAEREYTKLLVDLFLSASREDGAMTITGLQQLAQAIGVHKPERIVSKPVLIRLIQKASRHRPCYRTKPGEFCQDHSPCQWRAECQKLVAEWRR